MVISERRSERLLDGARGDGGRSSERAGGEGDGGEAVGGCGAGAAAQDAAEMPERSRDASAEVRGAAGVGLGSDADAQEGAVDGDVYAPMEGGGLGSEAGGGAAAGAREARGEGGSQEEEKIK